jgi:hypothetical protein
MHTYIHTYITFQENNQILKRLWTHYQLTFQYFGEILKHIFLSRHVEKYQNHWVSWPVNILRCHVLFYLKYTYAKRYTQTNDLPSSTKTLVLSRELWRQIHDVIDKVSCATTCARTHPDTPVGLKSYRNSVYTVNKNYWRTCDIHSLSNGDVRKYLSTEYANIGWLVITDFGPYGTIFTSVLLQSLPW